MEQPKKGDLVTVELWHEDIVLKSGGWWSPAASDREKYVGLMGEVIDVDPDGDPLIAFDLNGCTEKVWWPHQHVKLAVPSKDLESARTDEEPVEHSIDGFSVGDHIYIEDPSEGGVYGCGHVFLVKKLNSEKLAITSLETGKDYAWCSVWAVPRLATPEEIAARGEKPSAWEPLKTDKNGYCSMSGAACSTCPLGKSFPVCDNDPDFKDMRVRWWPGGSSTPNRAEFRYVKPEPEKPFEFKSQRERLKKAEPEKPKKRRPLPRPEGEMGEGECFHCNVIIPRELDLQIRAGTRDCPSCGWKAGRCRYCKGLLVQTWNSQVGKLEERCQDCHHLGA